MPYYGRYGGPEDFYQGSNFDPYTGRLQGGQMVMQVLNQIAADKRRKKEEAWELEDRELNKRYKEAQISNYGEQTTPRMSDIEMKAWLYKNDPELFDRLYPRPAGPKTTQQIEEEARARARGTASVRGTTADADERKDVVDARKTFQAESKLQKKRYDDLMNQQKALEKQIESTKLLKAKAKSSNNKLSEATLGQTLTQLQLQKDIIDGALDGLAKSFSATVKTQESRVIDGTTYYKWSDGKWYPRKEGSQTKK